MGMNHECIIAHNLAPDDLPLLPDRLGTKAAPGLARAVKLLARSYKRMATEWSDGLDNTDYDRAVEDKPDWKYIEPQRGVYLDSEGREVPPPPIPDLKPGERWPTRGPSAWRKITAEERWSDGYWIDYVGPADLLLDVHRHCCRFRSTAYPRWYTLLTEPDFQYAMRLVAYELGRIVGSTKAIYVPDSAKPPSIAIDVVSESGTFAEVIERLRRDCGPPAPTLASIEDRQDSWHRGDGYFIDDFADLKAATAQ